MNNTINCIDIDYKPELSNTLLFSIIGLFGMGITYLGNKLIKPTIFTGGTIISTISSYKLLKIGMNYSPYQDCLVLYGVSLLCGIIGGFNMLKWYYLVNFLLGMCAGSSIGYLAYVSYLHNYNIGKIWIFDIVTFLSIIVPGILFGLYTLKKNKEIMIILTSVIGPGLVVFSVNEFTCKILKWNYTIPTIFNIFIFISLFGSGFYIQRKRENKKINNKSQDLVNYQ